MLILFFEPATEYVRKFTEEVPREKVLVIEDVMDSSNKDNLGDVKVSKDDIIENVAEKILTQEKIVGYHSSVLRCDLLGTWGRLFVYIA